MREQENVAIVALEQSSGFDDALRREYVGLARSDYETLKAYVHDGNTQLVHEETDPTLIEFLSDRNHVDDRSERENLAFSWAKLNGFVIVIPCFRWTADDER